MERVAIISDDERFTRDATRAFQDAGYTLLTGRWQEQCIDSLKTFAPALIVLHFCREPAPEADMPALLEADPALRMIPVLMCSNDPGLQQTSFEDSTRASGAVQASTCQIEEIQAKARAMLASKDPGKTMG